MRGASTIRTAIAPPRPEVRVALVRHPAVAAPPGTCYGRLDVGLHPEAGPALARIVAELAGRTAQCIWTSPARRCRDTAAAVVVALRLQLYADERLRELDFGAWEGRPWSAVPRADLDRWAAAPLDFAPPCGESGASLLARVASFHAMLRDGERDCIVVAHGGPLKLLSAMLRGATPDLLAPAPALGSVEFCVSEGGGNQDSRPTPNCFRTAGMPRPA